MRLAYLSGTLVASMAFACAGSAAAADVLHQNALLNIPVGKVAEFSRLSSFDAQLVCLMQPYQNRLHFEGAEAVKANEYLTATNFKADESRFSYVLIGKQTVAVATFNRSQQLDAMAKHEVSPSLEARIPDNFVASDCAAGEAAAFHSVEFDGRTYLILGELH